MSRNQNQKPSTKIEDVLVPRLFELRLWDTWEAPSLIILLDQKERRLMRDTFDIHWEDLDIKMRMIDECCGTGSSHDQRLRRDKNVKVVYSLAFVPDEGIKVVVYIAAMTAGVENPLLDEHGHPRKLAFERLFPIDRIGELFNKANAFMMSMDAFKTALWAKVDGNEKIFGDIGRALEFAREGLHGADSTGLTVKVEEVVRQGAKQPKGEKKGGRQRAEKIGAVSTETTPEDSADDAARKLAAAVTGVDPGAGIVETDDAKPVPVASASPTPAAPKPPKKEKPKAIKLGSPEAAAKLAELGATPVTPSGTNGQS